MANFDHLSRLSGHHTVMAERNAWAAEDPVSQLPTAARLVLMSLSSVHLGLAGIFAHLAELQHGSRSDPAVHAPDCPGCETATCTCGAHRYAPGRPLDCTCTYPCPVNNLRNSGHSHGCPCDYPEAWESEPEKRNP
jgi:hypothetical protein